MKTTDFENGILYINGQKVDINSLDWNEHPTFKGVFLKHIIKGDKTGNQISCHLVKINPNATIGLHNHVGKIEIHEVLAGHGFCDIEGSIIEYNPGNVGFIPADKNHTVSADDNGLFLLAKFTPALL